MSDSLGENLISRTVGYTLNTGNFSTTSPNLPQRVVIHAEANHANQGTLDLTPTIITSAKEVGLKYGFGSPIYLIARILAPIYGGGLINAGVPIVVYPQAEAVGATSKKISITPSGVASGNGTHTIVIAGRGSLDGQSYGISILKGDSTADITGKIATVVNNILGCPGTFTATDYTADFETKWKGLTADDVIISVDTNGNSLGITYDVSTIQAGAGTPSVSAALDLIGNTWETIIVNSYGTVDSVMDSYESFNGVPDQTNPTGRFVATVGKPFVAITGSTDDDPSSITDSRSNQVTIAIAPAPGSAGLPMEAAANMTVVYANIAANTPELDAGGSAYPDMPTPSSIGSMADYANRQLFATKGCSTVNLINGVYVIEDFLTTYHPQGEVPAQFAYVRSLYCIDMNVKFTYQIQEGLYVIDHVIANDNDIVDVGKVVKPKQWKAVIIDMADDLVKRGLIVDSAFTAASITVGISTVNPYRFNTIFKYKRSGVALISSTVAIAGFNFGTLN